MAPRELAPIPQGKLRAPVVPSLHRPRVTGQLTPLTRGGLGLLVGPAGAGKTVALAQLAAELSTPTAWLSLDHRSADEATFLREVQAAVALGLDLHDDPWESVDDAIVSFDRLEHDAVLILDDLHEIEHGDALAALGRILDYRPHRLRLVVAGRTEPPLNLPRRRLAGEVHDVDADVLRFRTWEVDELFRHHFGDPLPPDDLASLTGRTEGWAAGLQFFHIATTGKGSSARRRLLRSLAGGPMVREYLAVNVLASLPEELRDFLVRTSVFDDLTASRCDRLLERADSEQLLRALHRRGVFTWVSDDGTVFRTHEVLRTHLRASVEAESGASGQRHAHRRAAAILESDHDLAGSLLGFCRSADWDEVRRILESSGADLVGDPGHWIDLLPGSIRQNDPWVLLAMARRQVAHGDLTRARQTLGRARRRLAEESAFGTGEADHRILETWLDPSFGRTVEWYEVLRQATVGSPVRLLGSVEPNAPLRAGAWCGVALLAGELDTAADGLDDLEAAGDLGPAATAAVQLARAVCAALRLEPDLDDRIDLAERAAKSAHQPAMARLAGAVRLIGLSTSRPDARHLVADCAREGDEWGLAFVLLWAGLGELLREGDPAPLLVEARERFGELRAPTLVAWASVLVSLTDHPSEEPDEVEILARSTGPLAHAVGLLARSRWSQDPKAAEAARRRAETTAARCGGASLLASLLASLDARSRGGEDAPEAADELVPTSGTDLPHGSATGEVAVRCLGTFELTRAGSPIDLSMLRPIHRDLLRLLCAHGENWLHREVLTESLWPGVEPEKAQRNVQVAISAVRRAIEPDAPRGEARIVQRDGQRYRLHVDGGTHDVVSFAEAVRLGDVARRGGRRDVAVGHYAEALAAYRGELLPGTGPAEWIVDERDALRADAARAAEHLTRLLLEAGRPAPAADVAHRGLEFDQYADQLWQLAIEAHEQADQPAAAAAARREYEDVLSRLDA